MRATVSASVARVGLFLGIALLTSCAISRSPIAPRPVKLYQNWQLQPGNTVAGYRITSGLGDISIDLKGKAIHAPFDGQVQPSGECVLFSSAEIPAYLFRFCGVQRPQLGEVRSGDAIGVAESLQFAALRKQPNGTWAFVEPSQSVLERVLTQ